MPRKCSFLLTKSYNRVEEHTTTFVHGKMTAAAATRKKNFSLKEKKISVFFEPHKKKIWNFLGPYPKII